MRQRWLSLLSWTLATCLLAGLYGALHNQVSYTISPDYFLAFKFDQFRFPVELRTRAGASLVGFLASWWTGIVIGPALYIAVDFKADAGPTRPTMIFGMMVTLAITFAVGIVAAFVAWNTTRTPLDVVWAPLAAADPVAFQRAGILHDGSYLGGLLGVIIACIAILAYPSGKPR